MKISLMIEGGYGLNWSRWQTLVRAAENLGFDGIYRSDHFIDGQSSGSDALEAYTSLTWAADNTERIELGTLVSPISFRDPRILAWQAAAVNDLAKGRLRVGLGAGWMVQEHEMFGFELGDLDERFARMENGVQVVKALLHSSEPVSVAGDYYTISDARLKPRHAAKNSPAIIIGGNGPMRTLPLVAKYADEWNGLMLNNHDFRAKSAQLDEMVVAEGRDRASVRRSQMTGCIIARDQVTLNGDKDAAKFDDMRGRGMVIGTPNEAVEILASKAEAGVESVMLQWMDMDDIAGLELVASDVLPQVRR